MGLSHFFRMIFMSALCSFVSVNMQAEHFRHITLSHGLSQPSVMAITQDKLGRMWFGTREGVNVYDGTSVHSYKGWVSDPVTGENVWIGNEVQSMVADSVGNLFMHIDNHIIKYDLLADRFSRFSQSSNVKAMSGYDGEVSFITSASSSADSIFVKDAFSDNLNFKFTVSLADSSSIIKGFCVTPEDFVISATDGLYFFDRATSKPDVMLDGMTVFSTYFSPSGTLWISTENNGLFRLAPGDLKPECVSYPKSANGALGAEQTRNAIEDQFGRIWYGSFSGLLCYDPSTGITEHIMIPANLGGLSHSSIFGMYKDRDGNIWAGSYYGGVNYFTPSHDRYFNFDYARIAPVGLFHSFVIDMVSDNDGNLWFGTDGGGVCCVDSAWNIVTELSTLSGHNALRQNNIKTLAYDPDGNRVYIGTHLGGLSYYDIDARKTVNLIDRQSDNGLPGNVIHHLQIFDGNLYISSRMGLSRMNLADGKFTKISSSSPQKFDIDKHGNLYYIRGEHLHIMKDIASPSPSDTYRKDRIKEWHVSILCSTDGVFVGTLGGGVYFLPYGEGDAVHFTSFNSPLPSDYCYAIKEDSAGNLYISTDNEVLKYNPAKESYSVIDFSDYFPESHIISDCGLMARDDGSVLVGSTKGITVLFDEVFGSGAAAEASDNLYFSHLTVGNKEIRPNDGSGIIDRILPYAEEIRLKPGQASFGLSIATGNYVNALHSQQYQYMLEGVDDSWLTSDNGLIHYTNLTPGTYILKARSLTDGDRGSEISLKVVVESPWYATWWAFLVYLLIAIATAYFVTRKTKDMARLKLSLRKEKFERQQIEKLNHEKLVFFTNVSHEFQTPLTLIMSHVDLLISKNKRNERLTAPLARVRSHAEQMSHLITQLLEFRKLQQNHQTVKIGRHDAGRLLATIAEQFKEYAERRGIRFEVRTPDEPVFGYYDPRLIDRVLVNIISNAFKYTPDGGEIICSVSKGTPGSVV